MPITPEAQARITIDALLQAAGWHVCNVGNVNIHAAAGVAIREFPLNNGFGFADYLLYVNGKARGVIEAKKQGATLTGVELQSGRYAQGLPAALPAWQLGDDFEYQPEELARAVQTPDQIRTVVRTPCDRRSTNMFPARTELPKALFFAKDDNHDEKTVEILREEFGRGNEFAQKQHALHSWW